MKFFFYAANDDTEFSVSKESIKALAKKVKVRTISYYGGAVLANE